jgi:hypothetical protein
MKTIFSPSYFCSATLLAVAAIGSAAYAQSSCSSDQQPVPRALLERFISADCDACWASASLPQPTAEQIALDWIVPSPRGDEAALSAAATLDAQARLQALQLPWTAAQASMQTSAVLKAPRPQRPNLPTESRLRVAHGLPFNGYIGASIEFEPSQVLQTSAAANTAGSTSANLLAYLVLIEALPAGAEGSNVQRNLVRNALITPWDLREQLTRSKDNGFKPLFESRPMSLPPGVSPDRLKVIGWVQDAQGTVLAAASSGCDAPDSAAPAN